MSVLFGKSAFFRRESSVKWKTRDPGIYTYLLQCWQVGVITDREVMGGKGLMPHRKQTARNLTMQQPLREIISCDGCEKSQGNPKCANAVMIWHLDGWIDILGGMFSFSTLLIEKWEWMEGMGWILMFSGMHHTDRAPPSIALVDTAGSSHYSDCWGMGCFSL